MWTETKTRYPFKTEPETIQDSRFGPILPVGFCCLSKRQCSYPLDPAGCGKFLRQDFCDVPNLGYPLAPGIQPWTG